MRLTVPLGLNMCPPFHSITKSERPASILPSARTVVEDETRRNAFWLAYATERQHGIGNGWALSLDDQDISQLLPVRGDQFEQGVSLSFPSVSVDVSF
jgi:Fungal specific transcription factor domain